MIWHGVFDLLHPAPEPYAVLFCDADVFVGSDTFADRMEDAGYIELVPVDDEALEDSFAYELGIKPGGSMYVLTASGRAALAQSEEKS